MVQDEWKTTRGTVLDKIATVRVALEDWQRDKTSLSRTLIKELKGLVNAGLQQNPSPAHIYPRKAPGIDGLSASFFLLHYDLIGRDIINLCMQLLNGSLGMSMVIKTVMVLIPKVEDPQLIKQLRNISLCTVVYKIVSKVLEMVSIMRRCWWSIRILERGWPLVDWKTMCMPKNVGGMGFRDMRSFNLALLGKPGYMWFNRVFDLQDPPSKAWKIIVKLLVLPKIKIFAWRMASDAIHVHKCLKAVGLSNGICPMCESDEESVIRAIRSCPRSQEALRLAGFLAWIFSIVPAMIPFFGYRHHCHDLSSVDVNSLVDLVPTASVIERLKEEEIQCKEMNDGSLLPLNGNTEENGKETTENDGGDMKNWMSSVQLWNSDSNNVDPDKKSNTVPELKPNNGGGRIGSGSSLYAQQNQIKFQTKSHNRHEDQQHQQQNLLRHFNSLEAHKVRPFQQQTTPRKPPSQPEEAIEETQELKEVEGEGTQGEELGFEEIPIFKTEVARTKSDVEPVSGVVPTKLSKKMRKSTSLHSRISRKKTSWKHDGRQP
ncbi:hypothetical protein F3Y22_tig00111769pilonHSYRG00648 [Hibiscus syriacus]|uniref:Reverse transcriptase zinc-binding domain-containing protein n=1 Tax=Hibiscus syriacus TaxID=106335 RepID=A0A6A2XFR9_HIBSY|nr:hypothetical protein F3Y22_tig00111769pilonHSYRG00648 [Hibiscus syriacus]